MSIHTAEADVPMRFETNQDLSSVTAQAIRANPPGSKQVDGAYPDAVEYTAVVSGTKLVHTKTALTFASAGKWLCQTKATFGVTEIQYGLVEVVEILPSI